MFIHKKNHTLALLLIIAALCLCLLYIIVRDRNDSFARDRDAIRLSDIGQIRNALDDYYADYHTYPPCLYASATCRSLEGSSAMIAVPKDPLTNIDYSYAAIGKGSVCTAYHLGTSLERTISQALLTGSDVPPHPDADLCKGSAKDFSGLSYAPGGQPCDTLPGIAQPTDSPHGESCYDKKQLLRGQ
jgi:hypothetical protein